MEREEKIGVKILEEKKMNKESLKLLRTIEELEIEILNKNIKKDKENKFSCMGDKKCSDWLRDRNTEQKWKEWKSGQDGVGSLTACKGSKGKGREVQGRKKGEKDGRKKEYESGQREEKRLETGMENKWDKKKVRKNQRKSKETEEEGKGEEEMVK